MAWLSAREFARRYGMHIKSVQRLARQGGIPAKKVGARWYVYDEDEPPAVAAPTAQSEVTGIRLQRGF